MQAVSLQLRSCCSSPLSQLYENSLATTIYAFSSAGATAVNCPCIRCSNRRYSTRRINNKRTSRHHASGFPLSTHTCSPASFQDSTASTAIPQYSPLSASLWLVWAAPTVQPARPSTKAFPTQSRLIRQHATYNRACETRRLGLSARLQVRLGPYALRRDHNNRGPYPPCDRRSPLSGFLARTTISTVPATP